jgi:hypothetical protein
MNLPHLPRYRRSGEDSADRLSSFRPVFGETVL